MMTIEIDFEPIGKRVEVEKGATILEAARLAGIEVVAVCGGMGTCERCRVEVINGIVSPITFVEKQLFSMNDLQHGRRLACQTKALSDVLVNLPPDSLMTPQRLQLEGADGAVVENDMFMAVNVALPVPTLGDLRSDATRLEDDLNRKRIYVSSTRSLVLQSFSDNIRAQDWHCRAIIQGGQIIAVLPTNSTPLGLAVDIGTTKVAAYLLDLENGDMIACQSAMNPQIQYGEDVISRIYYCMEHENGRSILQACIVETLNKLIEELCHQTTTVSSQIVEAVVVGNTVMHHLFTGLPIKQLGFSPFIAAVNKPIEISASIIGMNISPAANVYLPGNIAGYVGADHVAMMLATDAYQSQDTVIAVDVGTNTEISLVNEGHIYCCSCASGPAFEGAHIYDGMRAANGAIERVQIEGERVHFMTVGGQAPVGICGSGILDAIAEMVRNGFMDYHGVLAHGSCLVRGTGRSSEFILVSGDQTGTGHDIILKHKDIQEIMLAKAAIRTGIEILLIQAGIKAALVDRFIIAGAFGTYLDLRSAIQIGMFPDLPLERFSQVGNAAGAGARKLLVSSYCRQSAAQFAERMEYVELTNHPRFTELFMDMMGFVKG